MRHFVGAGSDFFFHDWHATRTDVNSLLLQKASHDFGVIHCLGGTYGVRVAAFGDRDHFGGTASDSLQCPECPDRDACREEQLPSNPRRRCAFRSSVDVEDNQIVIVRLANGVKASYAQCHFTPECLRNYTVVGTAGRIEFDLEAGSIRLYTRPAKSRDWATPPPPEPVPLDPTLAEGGHGSADPRIASAFLRLLRDGIAPKASPQDGRMSVAVGCAAVESLRAGRMVDVPPLPT